MQDFPQQDQTNCESEVCEIQNNAFPDYPEKEQKVNGLIKGKKKTVRTINFHLAS